MPAVFDIDGTLIRLEAQFDVCFTRAVTEVLGETGFSEDWFRYPNVTDAGIVHHIFRQHRGRDAKAEELERIQDVYLAELERNGGAGAPIDGAEAFLALVARSGRSVAIATGNWAGAARWKLRAAGLDLNHIPMATADDAPERARILALAIERAGPGSDPVYFGDGQHDRRAAAKLGVRFIHIGEGRDLADYTDTVAAMRLLNPI